MIEDPWAQDLKDFHHFVKKPRLEECALDAALGEMSECCGAPTEQGLCSKCKEHV
jgi:hypothetical protein